jgi:phosphoenolpyruvate synthase/pyruvate phosphate dikinase
MKELLWLDETGCDDAKVVGGKAANLGRLMTVHRVPPGFCLTAAAHARWAGDTSPEGPFPDDLRSLVEEAYSTLGRRADAEALVVAVRSSAVDEDGAEASFAGIYITCLNVRGADDVLRAIARCWASAADPRVKTYRESRGLSPAGVGVLVQELVVADAAAVAFSKNPTTGAADEIVINANWGLGESIVGGLATPDTWVLNKADLSTRSFHLGPKEHMTILAGSGTREVSVMRTMRARPSLGDAQVRALADLTVRLEEKMGWPVDVECAFQRDELYLLQCRPVTAAPRGQGGAP